MQNHDVTGEELTTDAWTEVKSLSDDDWIQIPPAPERHENESGIDRLVDTITGSVENSQPQESSGGSEAGGETAEDISVTTSNRAQRPTTTSEPDTGTCQSGDPPAQVSLDQVNQVRSVISDMSRDVNTILEKATTVQSVLKDFQTQFLKGDGQSLYDDMPIACEYSDLGRSAHCLWYIHDCADKQRSWIEEGGKLLDTFFDEIQGATQLGGPSDSNLESGKAHPATQEGDPTGPADKTRNDNVTTEPTSSANDVAHLSHQRSPISNIAEMVQFFGARDCQVLPRILIESKCIGSRHVEQTKLAGKFLLDFEDQYRERHTQEELKKDSLVPQLPEINTLLDDLEDACSAQEKAIANAYKTFVSREAEIFDEQQENLYRAEVDAERSRQPSE